MQSILGKLKERKNKVYVFTGAGMSTESGLPDFRSGTGIWRKFDPLQLATVKAMENNYEAFHEFYSLRLTQGALVKPNQGHEILAEWEARGLVQGIITQNVDDLHRMAGSKNISELHGRLDAIRCMACDTKAKSQDFLAKKPCEQCGEKLRPGVVLFGENLPINALVQAESWAREANVFIVLGSSLQVSPANQLPQISKQNNSFLILCNRDETLLDYLFDVVSHDEIGKFLKELNF